MALKITKPVPCNQLSPNKGVKLGKVAIEENRIAYKDTDLGIIVLKPIIDRLTFGFHPKQSLFAKYGAHVDLAEWCDYIAGSFAGDAFHGDGIKFLTSEQSKKLQWGQYKTNIEYRPDKKSKPIIIQAGPNKENRSLIRVDMNPSQITTLGMAKFFKMVLEQLAAPTLTITHEDFLIWSKINHLEIAIDILGIRPNDIDIWPVSAGKEVAAKQQVYKSVNSARVETIYPKVKRSKSNTEYLYDKRQELLDRGLPAMYGESLHSRFEVRVGESNFFKMKKFTNRCTRVGMKAMSYKTFAALPFDQKLFIQNAINRTPEKALEVIPAELKATFEPLFNQVMKPIWKPKEIWQHWKATVETSGLLPLAATS